MKIIKQANESPRSNQAVGLPARPENQRRFFEQQLNKAHPTTTD